MSTRKRQIIQKIIDSLKLIDGGSENLPNSPRSPYKFTSNVYNNVFSKQEFLDNINDFPSVFCYSITPETRNRIGGRETYCSFIIEIRGYVQGENPIGLASDLGQDIQYIIESIKYRCGSNLGLVECRTESLSTDEGLLEPYGVVELRTLIVYIQDYDI